MVLAATSSTKSSKETSDAYLGRVTHLHLQGKRVKIIEGLELCTNLKVLYLYDNMIEHIQGLNNQTILYYLYLQNNKIKDLGHLHMPALKKLYLDDNDLHVVSGLGECNILEELHLARQRLPSYTSLQFEPESLHAISGSLQVLEISGCGIAILSNLRILRQLRKIFAKDNLIADLNEVEALISMPRIEEASFSGNPCCKMYKYRDIVIAAAPDSLKLLDDSDVFSHQQVAIRGLVAMRRKEGYLTNFIPPGQRFSED